MPGDDVRNDGPQVDSDARFRQQSVYSKVNLPLAARQEFNQFVYRFEDAWQHDDRPDIAQFLPADGPLRLTVLQELVRIDFEYRRDHEDQAEPTEYLTRFPELTVDAVQLQNLLTWFSQHSRQQRDDSNGNTDDDRSTEYWSSIRPGRVLGNYTVLELIGRGGMGAVFKARHEHMNRVVALKTISPLAMKSPEAVKRFHREVRAAARLDHPNIITAHDADKFGDVHVLIMQYVEGRDLASVVRQQGPLSIDDAIDCLQQAASGLEYAHRQGVIHRDIKPSNLIRSHSGQLKILDMGLARIEQALSAGRDDLHELTLSGEFVGTPDFMSPEQAFDAKNASYQADVYSLGCTIYYLLTGNNVFVGGSFTKRMLAHREAPIPRLRDARPDVPDWLDAVFQRMVAKQAKDRFQTMSELLAALGAKSAAPTNRRPITPQPLTVLSNTLDFVPDSSPFRSITSSRNRKPRTWQNAVMAVSIFVAVLTIGFFVWQQFPVKPALREQPSQTQEPPNDSLPAPDANTETIRSSPAALTLSPIMVTEIASDSKYSLLVGNGILLSPDNGLFSDIERDTIKAFQAAHGTSASALTLFFAGRLDTKPGRSVSRIQVISPETCLTAWIVLRDGQQPERLDVYLDSRDVAIDAKGASSISVLVIAFAPTVAAADYLGARGLACKVLPIEH